jgi:hypothetical protein
MSASLSIEYVHTHSFRTFVPRKLFMVPCELKASQVQYWKS